MTQKERFEFQELREEIFKEYKYRCAVCGRSILAGVPQLAHRIAQTKANIKRYGKAVIHHRLNMLPVCSLACNCACNIGNQPMQADALAHKIEEEIENAR